MQNRFDSKLEELHKELIKMGALCENAIALSLKALLEDDLELAKAVEEVDNEIDQKEKDIERLCMRILLRFHPVSSDLRNVSSALKMITDMERIGDQAQDIAEIVGYASLSEILNKTKIADMARHAIVMVTGSVDSFVRKDTKAAYEVIDHDDIVDQLFLEVKNDIINLILQNKEYSGAALDVLMIAKYLERIADHAVNIAEWVLYSITGKHEG